MKRTQFWRTNGAACACARLRVASTSVCVDAHQCVDGIQVVCQCVAPSQRIEEEELVRVNVVVHLCHFSSQRKTHRKDNNEDRHVGQIQNVPQILRLEVDGNSRTNHMHMHSLPAGHTGTYKVTIVHTHAYVHAHTHSHVSAACMTTPCICLH